MLILTLVFVTVVIGQVVVLVKMREENKKLKILLEKQKQLFDIVLKNFTTYYDRYCDLKNKMKKEEKET